jgi:hypothetical protein
MAQTVHDNLKPGQHFVASIANILQPPQPIFDQRKYGFSFRLLEETLHEGAKLRGTLFLGEKTVEFDFYWLPWDAYEQAFRAAGFRSWKIEPFLIPPDSERTRSEGFWEEYLARPSGMHITCQK